LEAGGVVKPAKGGTKKKAKVFVVAAAENAVASGSGSTGAGGGGELPVAPKVVDRLPGESAAQSKKRKKEEEQEEERKKVRSYIYIHQPTLLHSFPRRRRAEPT